MISICEFIFMRGSYVRSHIYTPSHSKDSSRFGKQHDVLPLMFGRIWKKNYLFCDVDCREHIRYLRWCSQFECTLLSCSAVVDCFCYFFFFFRFVCAKWWKRSDELYFTPKIRWLIVSICKWILTETRAFRFDWSTVCSFVFLFLQSHTSPPGVHSLLYPFLFVWNSFRTFGDASTTLNIDYYSTWIYFPFSRIWLDCLSDGIHTRHFHYVSCIIFGFFFSYFVGKTYLAIAPLTVTHTHTQISWMPFGYCVQCNIDTWQIHETPTSLECQFGFFFILSASQNRSI